jgi:chromosome segregation ATPase
METVTITARKATQENVSRACRELVAAGQKPTVDAVRLRIGGGSPNDVSPMIKKWKTDTLASKDPAPQITLDPSIANLIAQHMAAYAANAAHAAEERAAEAEENVRSLADAGQLLEHRVAQLQARLDASQAQVQQMAGQLAERGQELELVRDEARAAVDSSEAKVMAERAAAEAIRQELARAQIRAESVPVLEKALAVANEDLKNLAEHLANAQKSAAVSEARSTAAQHRAEQAEAREADARADAARLRDEVARGHASTQELTRTLAKVSADLAAALERQEPFTKAGGKVASGLQNRVKQNADANHSSG